MFRLSVCLWQTLIYISTTIADILMQLFAFGTTLRCADYIKSSNQSDQQCYQQNSSKLQILCPPYLKNGLSQLKNFLYSRLMLLNLALISFSPSIQPSAKQGCHFT
ncbi:hypothetical protein O3M35_006477 [Rhynocoris fuscipes]|uniref:Uncharacterized protein n=1 Tax=Rhynocoris fuscipes TaxID=488301 RepID=A0AAW1DKX3_9HEMI